MSILVRARLMLSIIILEQRSCFIFHNKYGHCNKIMRLVPLKLMLTKNGLITQTIYKKGTLKNNKINWLQSIYFLCSTQTGLFNWGFCTLWRGSFRNSPHNFKYECAEKINSFPPGSADLHPLYYFVAEGI